MFRETHKIIQWISLNRFCRFKNCSCSNLKPKTLGSLELQGKSDGSNFECRTWIDRILDWPNGFWSTWTYLFKHTKCTLFVKPCGFGQSEIWSIRCLPFSMDQRVFDFTTRWCYIKGKTLISEIPTLLSIFLLPCISLCLPIWTNVSIHRLELVVL